MHNANGMELIGRIAAAMGISLVLTLLLMALYQVDTPVRATRAQGPANSLADSR